MRIKASDIFDVTIGNGSFPFDLQFEPKNSVGLVLKQPLVYVLRYQNTALYVGYTFVKKDVRVSRWTKQLESILCRGYRVGFNQGALIAFESSNAITSAQKKEAKSRLRNTSVMTSVKRVNWASAHWGEISKLSPANQYLLSEFSFEILSDPSINTLKECQLKTKKSIQSLNPLCNG
jgi:predicted GIY-YIG superfamily endonuclease